MNIENKSPILIIASTNQGKVNEFKSLLEDFPLEVIMQPDGLIVNETGKTFLENARIKAKATSKYTGKNCLADDSGLCIASLDGAPGINSARYANTDHERIQRVLKELSGVQDRKAYFISALCISSPDGEILIEVQGKCEGVITNTPRGEKGFGYDPIFEVIPTGKTFAEMGEVKKQKLGHRGKAFELLKPSLTNILANF